MLEMRLTFGPKYFDDTELKSCVRNHLVTYYNFLGSTVGRGKSSEFWNFHRERMMELNHLTCSPETPPDIG